MPGAVSRHRTQRVTGGDRSVSRRKDIVLQCRLQTFVLRHRAWHHSERKELNVRPKSYCIAESQR